jgi:hypothetical protein
MAWYLIYTIAAYKVYRRTISGRVYETEDLLSVGRHDMFYPEMKTTDREK